MSEKKTKLTWIIDIKAWTMATARIWARIKNNDMNACVCACTLLKKVKFRRNKRKIKFMRLRMRAWWLKCHITFVLAFGRLNLSKYRATHTLTYKWQDLKEINVIYMNTKCMQNACKKCQWERETSPMWPTPPPPPSKLQSNNYKK